MVILCDRFQLIFGISTIFLINTNALLHDLSKVDLSSLSLSKTCRHDLEYFRTSYQGRELWAQKMADASGRIQFGFVWGNNMMLGSPTHCKLLNKPFEYALYRECDTESLCNITEIVPPFPVDYKVTYAYHIAKIQISTFVPKRRTLHIGTCGPKSCSTDDTTKFIDKLLHTDEFVEQTFIENTTEVLYSKDLNPRSGFSEYPAVKILRFLIIIFVSLTVIGTFNHSYGEGNLNKPFNKFCSCFSIQENLRSILSTTSHPGEIGSLHGLRAIKLYWVTSMHAIVYCAYGITDMELAIKYVTNPNDVSQVSADFSVDAFLAVSGLVLAYSFFGSAAKLKNKNKLSLFLKIITNRIIRLSPTFYIIFLIYFVTTMYLNDTSQLTYFANEEDLCQEQWWYNFLYISNLRFAPKEMCMNWSWYLAVDTQCFVIVLPVLLIALKSKKSAIGLLLGLLVSSSCLVGYYGYKSPHMLNHVSLQKYGFYLYSSISSRLGPYIVGVLGGWLLVETKSQLKLNNTQAKIASLFCAICLLWPTLRRMNPAVDNPVDRILYIALSRLSFAIGFIWIVIACENGLATSMNSFLKADFFKPISKMSYSAYLLNPIVVIFATMDANTPKETNFSDWYISMSGYAVITLIVSLIFMLVFEMPIKKLFKIILGS